MCTLNPDIMYIHIIPKLVKSIDLVVFITFRLISDGVKHEIERHCHERYRAVSLPDLSKVDQMIIIRDRGYLILDDVSSGVIKLGPFISTPDYIFSFPDKGLVWCFRMLHVLTGAKPKNLVTFIQIMYDLVNKIYDIDALVRWICPDFFLFLLDQYSALFSIYADKTNLAVLVQKLDLCEKLENLIAKQIDEGKLVDFIYLVWWYAVHGGKYRNSTNTMLLCSNYTVKSQKRIECYINMSELVSCSDTQNVDAFLLYLLRRDRIHNNM